jgi:inner membrane protein
MSPTGHNFTGAALALALGLPLYQAGAVMEGAMIAAGAMLGARAPDWTEMARWINDKRYSLIPHRGPTHWPGTWLAGLALAFFTLQAPLREAVIGFCLSALLHLVMDVLTPSGIPLWHPFARKKLSLRVYRSGSLLPEAGLVLLCWGVAGITIIAS